MVLLVRRSILRSASENPQMSEKCRRQAESGPQTEETIANGKAALILSPLRWTPVGCQGCASARVLRWTDDEGPSADPRRDAGRRPP